jgi:hypothetical protein
MTALAGEAGVHGYEKPSVTVLDEEELLNVFQMTAAEISVAGCWWTFMTNVPCT